MRVLIIGAHSYIAERFIRLCRGRFEITALSRGPDLPSYFDLDASAFEGVDAIINFAAIVHDRHPDAYEAHRVNGELPLALAQLAKEAGVSHFIQLSTIAVYGKASHIDAKTPTHPETTYGKSKLEGEDGIVKLADTGFTVSVVRPTVVYGPDAPGNMRSLQKLIALGWPLPLDYRKNSRAILYVDNLVEALARIIERHAGGLFLLKDRQMLSMAEITKALRSGLGRRTPLFALPEWLVGTLCTLRFLPFDRLYGNLVIDDSRSLQVLGDYAQVESSKALEAMAKGAWA